MSRQHPFLNLAEDGKQGMMNLIKQVVPRSSSTVVVGR